MWSTTVTKVSYAALLPPPLLQREAAEHFNFTTHMYTHTNVADGRPKEDQLQQDYMTHNKLRL